MGITWPQCRSDEPVLRQAYRYALQQSSSDEKTAEMTTHLDPTLLTSGRDGESREESAAYNNVKIDALLRQRALQGSDVFNSLCEIDLDKDGKLDRVYTVERAKESCDKATNVCMRTIERQYYFDLKNNGEGIDLVYSNYSRMTVTPSLGRMMEAPIQYVIKGTVALGEVEILIDPVKRKKADKLAQEYADQHPQGPVIFVVKELKLLYFFIDGKIVQENVDAGEYLPFLKGQNRKYEMKFPVSAAFGIADGPEKKSTFMAGSKKKRGDRKTPEGEYFICAKTTAKSKPKSDFTNFMAISYPNIEDAREGLESKKITQAQFDQIVREYSQGRCPRGAGLGDGVGLHAQPERQREEVERAERITLERRYISFTDWTHGCIAVEDIVARYIFNRIPFSGTPIKIISSVSPGSE